MGPLEPKTHSVIVLDPEVVHNKILQLKCLIIIHIINKKKKKDSIFNFSQNSVKIIKLIEFKSCLENQACFKMQHQ